MENEKSLVRVSEVRLPKFVEDAYNTIEGMNQFAQMLLDSKLVPDHFYEKGLDHKTDYTKGKKAAVVIVLLQAQQLAIPPMTALQHVIPVNGLLSIKGDLAKTMIFASGKLRKDTWVETVTGSIEKEDMVVAITATRDDNGITLTRTFSVDKAKRMGLWITSAQANGTDGWKWQKSAWYKTPDRMVMYRCIGFIARDLFSDVLLNMYTTEEAMDIGKETAEIIETESGAKITIPDKEHSKARSTKMTDRVADKIPDNKFGEVKKDNIQDAVVVNEDPKNMPEEYTERNKVTVENRPEKKEEPQSTFTNQMNALKTTGKDKDETPFKADKESVEYMNGVKIIRDEQGNIANQEEVNAGGEGNKEVIAGQWTLKQMEGMDTAILLKTVMEDMDLMEGSEIIGGKNTNKKLRELILAHQENRLDAHIAPYLKANEEREKQETASTVNTQAGEIPIDKTFDKEKEDKKIDDFLNKTPLSKKETPTVPQEAGNKYGIIVSATVPRDFSEVKGIFNKMMGVDPQITTPRYMSLAEKLGLFKLYPDKETFIKQASVSEINTLLDAN